MPSGRKARASSFGTSAALPIRGGRSRGVTRPRCFAVRSIGAIMRVHTVAELLTALEGSRLLHSRYLRQIHDQVAAGPTDLTVERLATSLLRARVLTRFQIQRLLDGHTDGFYLGQYKLFDVLGRGGMGTVYLAEQTSMRRLVALKVIKNLADSPPETLVRFRREARAVALLSHSNIVHAFDYEELNGVPFMTMEYVEGIDTAELVERFGKLPWPQAADYMMQAALGLEHARLHGLVHRDIKPANLLVASDGTLKVMDLGLCLWADDEHDALKSRDIQVGTVDYMAPEQAVDCRLVDTRADIYSLGCVFYVLLAGRLPFVARTTVQKLLMHQSAAPRPIHQFRHDLPTPLSDIVHTMLEKKPEDRFQTPGIVAEALKPWSERTVPPFPMTIMERSRQRYHLVLGRAPESTSLTVREQSRAFVAAKSSLISLDRVAAVRTKSAVSQT